MSLFLNDLVYTVGPASLNREREMFSNGATGVRLTFSFGTPMLQEERARSIRLTAVEVGKPCHVLADLPGEKFRLGTFEGPQGVTVRAGQAVHLVPAQTGPAAATGVFPVRDSHFFGLVRRGDQVIVGDGAAVFRVAEVHSDGLLAEAICEGVVDQTRGLTVQGAAFQPQSLTDKDRADLQYIAASDAFDSVVLSFVSTADDVIQAKRIVSARRQALPVGAKIETSRAIDAVEDIARAADFLVAARGDLALAIPWVELPGAVEAIAAAAKAQGIPWILATQVAEGLQRFVLPTRAEICDLGHWLEREASGVLLCYETAFGPRPEVAVSCVVAMLERWGRSGR